jgi:hypothetical protein
MAPARAQLTTHDYMVISVETEDVFSGEKGNTGSG